MGIVVDVIILICLLSSMLISYRRGLSGSVFRIISFVLAVLLTLILYKPVAKMVIDKTSIDVSIKNSIIEVFKNSEKEEEQEEIQEVKEDEEDNELVGGFLETMKEKAEGAVGEAKDRIIEDSAEEIALKIVYIGVGVLLFFAIRIILLVVEVIISFITKLPIIEQVDKLGGIIYGFVEGVIIVYILLAIISFMNVINIMEPIHNAISESILGSFMYQHNIILKLFMK